MIIIRFIIYYLINITYLFKFFIIMFTIKQYELFLTEEVFIDH